MQSSAAHSVACAAKFYTVHMLLCLHLLQSVGEWLPDVQVLAATQMRELNQLRQG